MTDKITLTNLVNLTNQTTAVNAINSNNAVITTAFDNTLSRDGTAPNQMGAVLDMNGNNIINLPAPATSTSPVRLQDVVGNTVIGSIPTGGTTGQVLSKNSSANFDTGWSNVGTGTVTNVGLSLPTDFTVTNSPVTTTGTLTGVWATTPTGTGAVVRATSPTLVTPNIGVATATSVNGGTPITTVSTVGGDLTGNYPSPTVATNAVTNAKLAQAGAYTIKGNTSGATANLTDFTIGGLTSKTTPAGTDLVVIQDQAAGGALKSATVSSIGASSTVSSVNTLTGALQIVATDGAVVSASGTNIATGGPGGLVNKFRNGTFDIWQRGTSSFGTTTTPIYTADGWYVGSTGANVAVTRGTPRSLTTYSLTITGATSVTNATTSQRIESNIATQMNSQNVTFQAQVFNNTGGTITPTLTVLYPTVADNYASTTTQLNGVSLQACTNAAWTQVAYTFAAGSGIALGAQIQINWGNNLSTSGKAIALTECDIRVTPGLATGLQTVPPPVELRPIHSELAFCQRYYFQNPALNYFYCNPQATTTGTQGYLYYFPVTMRVNPTITLGTTSYNNASGLTSANPTPTAVDWQFTVSGSAAFAGLIFGASAEI